MAQVYLDYNASTPIDPEVIAAMRPLLEAGYGNPSSGHWAAAPAKAALENARRQVAALLGCAADEIVFTSGGSEANNLALKGTCGPPRKRPAHVITSQIEHPATLEPCHHLARLGVAVSYVPVDGSGLVDPDDIRKAITPDTCLISVMHANNEVGTIQPIADIARIAHEHGIRFHTDAAQSIGKIATRVDGLGADLLSVAGHKVYAPKGIGALYIRNGVTVEPLIHGAGHEGGRRAGTESALLSAALGRACEVAQAWIGMPEMERLRDLLWDSLQAAFGNRVVLNGHPARRLPNTLNVSFAGRIGVEILAAMPDVAASTGSACHAGQVTLSPVLQAMHVAPEVGMGAIRFSLGRYTAQDEVDEVVSQLAGCLHDCDDRPDLEEMSVAAASSTAAATDIQLGIRANLNQFLLLILLNAFVGGMVGLERTVVPLIGSETFHLASASIVTGFIVSFGVVKGLTNLVSGQLAETWGRKHTLVLGWLFGLPVPFMIMWAPSWSWVIAANVLLGVNQGLAWSMTVLMKIDLVGPKSRGLAVGLNEFAGYFAVGITAFLTGWIAARYGLRPSPFYLGAVYAALGLGLSILAVRDTADHVRHEVRAHGHGNSEVLKFWQVFRRTSFGDRRLFATCQAGLVNNLKDGMAWGLFPLFFVSYGLDVQGIGVLKAVYPACWGILQIVTGPMSDRIGRRGLVVWGLWLQASALALTALTGSFDWWLSASALLGVGTAMVYPTLIAAISDAAHPAMRARSLSVYRFWRDIGYAVGALSSGLIADFFGFEAAILVTAVLALLSGAVFAILVREERRQ